MSLATRVRRLVEQAPRPDQLVPDALALFTAAFGPPDPWQERALSSSAQRLSFNVARQLGKSSVSAALAAHTALSRPGSLTLVVSPSLRQSGESFRKMMDCYAAAGRPVPPESATKLSLELASGSRVVSLPGKENTIRGYSGVDLLIIDEASRVADETYYSVRPMLAVSGGRLVTLSTPFGMRGWWHSEWVDGEGWERYRVPASECARVSATFLEEERRSLGPLFYASEYCCEFCEVDNAVFSHADIAAALDNDIEPLFPIEGVA